MEVDSLRLKVTGDVQEALLACALPGDTSARLPIVEDWAALLYAAHLHGLLPLVAKRVRESTYPIDAKRAFLASSISYSQRLNQLEKYLARTVAALEEAGVPSLVLKGPALANSIYPNRLLRPYGDLDIVCREDDWLKTHAVLTGLGFEPEDGLTTPPPKVWNRKSYYHTQYVLAPDAVLVEVHYDLWQIGLRPRLGDRFWQRTQPVNISGQAARMLAPEDQLLHLAVHLHHHGYKRLIWFTDLAVLLSNTPGLDWDYLVWAAKQEGVGPSVYYSLYYVDQLLGVSAPESVLARLRPSRLQRLLHDHLWPAAPILNLEMDSTVSCGEFHEVPEASELVGNLILSGRRLEKAMYLLRLLAPSDKWLAYYYGTTDQRTLQFRRIVHAPKLLSRAAYELGMAFVRAAHGQPWIEAHSMHGA